MYAAVPNNRNMTDRPALVEWVALIASCLSIFLSFTLYSVIKGIRGHSPDVTIQTTFDYSIRGAGDTVDIYSNGFRSARVIYPGNVVFDTLHIESSPETNKH